MSNSAIAQRLGVASKTVANNVSAVFAKLQVADRSQAIVRARRLAWGRVGDPARSLDLASPPSFPVE